MKTGIETIGICGAGTMGSGIAQKFAQEGFRVILADRSPELTQRGLARVGATLDEGVRSGMFTPDRAAEVLARISGTHVLDDLKSCDLVVEAIHEDFRAKSDLFRALSGLLPESTLVATNTSSFSVTELAASMRRPERFFGLHYFYHAAKNRLVEIVPGEETSADTMERAYRLSILSGKDPVFTKDAYGFAVNRFFVPWLNEAVRIHQEGIAGIDAIDAVCRRQFGIGMGPFALMNATGIPVAMHAQQTLSAFGPSYLVADALRQQVEKKADWPVQPPDAQQGTGWPDAKTEERIADRMLGCVFFVCSQILDENVCSAVDLNKGARIGLRWRKGPVEIMLNIGELRVRQLAEAYAVRYGEPVPHVDPVMWRMEQVLLEKHGFRAVVRMNRPEDLNALNASMFRQLDEKFGEAERDPETQTVFITGSGKAFVAGADIRFFVDRMKDGSIDRIVEFTRNGQEVLDRIDRSSKRVVAVLNGLTLGGGLELALCADLILALPSAMLAFPETGIGIYPGLGGTQRTARRVGKGLAKFLILTGKTITAQEAKSMGLVDAVIDAETAFGLFDGSAQLPVTASPVPDATWQAMGRLYAEHTVESIMKGLPAAGDADSDRLSEQARMLRRKAPIAVRIADELIERAGGPASELEKLVTIFSTQDAMLGLSSVGRKVEYEGK